MSTKPYNPQIFCTQTKMLEQEFYQLAIDKAKKEALDEKASRRANSLSSRICRQAFNTFKNNLENTFSSDDCKSLVDLTLKSRESLFFVDLREQIKNILCDRGDQIQLVQNFPVKKF